MTKAELKQAREIQELEQRHKQHPEVMGHQQERLELSKNYSCYIINRVCVVAVKEQLFLKNGKQQNFFFLTNLCTISFKETKNVCSQTTLFCMFK